MAALRVLVTTPSFLDTPGHHQKKLQDAGFEVVTARGPHREEDLLPLIGDGTQFDGFIVGEDQFGAAALRRAMPRCKVVSKYGVGLDKIDLEAAKELGIKVTNTPGVNHTTVTELTFGLMLSLIRKIPEENNLVHRGEWMRLTGSELAGKTLAIFGFGRVGKEVAKRALAFGMQVVVYNTSWSPSHIAYVAELNRLFAHPMFSEYPPQVTYVSGLEAALARADIITLHMNLTRSNPRFVNRRTLSHCRRGVYIVNASRGGLVDEHDLAGALRQGQVAGYAADVLDSEPVFSNCPLLGMSNVILTPHIGSRTREGVERQGMAAVENLIQALGVEFTQNAA